MPTDNRYKFIDLEIGPTGSRSRVKVDGVDLPVSEVTIHVERTETTHVELVYWHVNENKPFVLRGWMYLEYDGPQDEDIDDAGQEA